MSGEASSLPAHASTSAGAPGVVVFAGIAAALHLGKLAPAIPALQETLGIGLVAAGFLLSLVQGAGMLLGLLAGITADAIGLRRSMLGGLALLTLASAAGAAAGTLEPAAPRIVGWLLALRAVEGVGFLMAVMPGPGLIRKLAPVAAEKKALGWWGAYMPIGVALALLVGPLWMERIGWVAWWSLIACISAAAGLLVFARVPRDVMAQAGDRTSLQSWDQRLRTTCRASGPRYAALSFGVYSSQWMAVIGFLPSIYAAAGVPPAWNAALTAIAAAMNMVGNIGGGQLLQRGVAPVRLLRWGFAGMGLGGLMAFLQPGGHLLLPPEARYAAVCLFSMAGGMIPATLFMLAVRVAPGAGMVSTTVGLIQQASAVGQFLAPPLVAFIAHRAGGWEWTWVVTLACSLTGAAVATRVASAARTIGVP